jgi:hypothetical protein
MKIILLFLVMFLSLVMFECGEQPAPSPGPGPDRGADYGPNRDPWDNADDYRAKQQQMRSPCGDSWDKYEKAYFDNKAGRISAGDLNYYKMAYDSCIKQVYNH